jgi:hypothetical protein
MRRVVFVLAAVVALAGVVAYVAPASGQAMERPPRSSESKSPRIPRLEVDLRGSRRRDLNDSRALLGNDVAIKAYREKTLPFPDGTIIARLAWSYVPSEENNKVFGRLQSFVAGPPKNGVQFMVKDSRK